MLLFRALIQGHPVVLLYGISLRRAVLRCSSQIMDPSLVRAKSGSSTLRIQNAPTELALRENRDWRFSFASVFYLEGRRCRIGVRHDGKGEPALRSLSWNAPIQGSYSGSSRSALIRDLALLVRRKHSRYDD